MKIVQIVATVDDPTAGPSHSVRQLCAGLDQAGEDVALHTVKGWRATRPVSEPWLHRHGQDWASAPLLGSACLSRELLRTLRDEARSAAVLHTHGLWLMPNVYPAWAARGTACATMISPRGMLGGAALGFSAAKKQIFWRLLQRNAVQRAGCLHATGDAEHDEIRQFDIDRPVAVIPNGVDLPPLRRTPDRPTRTAITIGRIHPKKGLPNLVKAWSVVESEHPDWRLRIIGPSERGHAEELMRLAASLGVQRVSIEDALTGDDKANALAEADLFVLPTLNENFAMTVAESLAAGTAVIATKGAPWAGLEDKGCGWWIDIGAEPLAHTLRLAMGRPRTALKAMGLKGRDWMEADFGWDQVAARMTEVYRWLAGRGERPSQVRIA